ncbi:MAG: riboflavin synthase [Saprospiraceae bacterium]|nr:riboflavin synthase [Saprospiraceae bacterium]MBK8450004.1 riboflavin synthase [Saprospiraceae bacterium]MBK8483944.1 riboflavin synthase [Saprospiraceae bacterium]MBK9221354.1 riboflavin synthase [Saprospiraceae bacterium]MBK9721712.1 riboflavin synthase [Saprospiraceae bacterium]
MFTGIIETTGVLKSISKQKNNLYLEIQSEISKQLKVDQSVSHNGICLTVVKKTNKTHFVTAVKETIDKSNIGALQLGDLINLERALVLGDRLDGHLVSGHIDRKLKIINQRDQNGSTEFIIELDPHFKKFIIEKGSITINGISLTVSKLKNKTFSVFIIPYTLEHTNLKLIKKGDFVNVEFDIIGKYIHRMYSQK